MCDYIQKLPALSHQHIHTRIPASRLSGSSDTSNYSTTSYAAILVSPGMFQHFQTFLLYVTISTIILLSYKIFFFFKCWTELANVIKKRLKFYWCFFSACGKLKEDGATAILDLTWSGWYKGKQLAISAGLPYLRVDTTIRPFVRCLNDFLMFRNGKSRVKT